MTASTSKKPAETVTTQVETPQAATSSDYVAADFTAHHASDEGNKPADNPASAMPAKETSRKTFPAFVLGMLGGLSIAVILALLALIFNPLADITERLSTVETNVAGAATRRAMETNDKRLVAIESRMEAFRADLDTLNRNPITGPIDLNGIKTHLGQIDQMLLALQQEASKTKPPPSILLAQDAARLTLALLITDKLEQGQPMAMELQAVEPLLVDQTVLTSLKPWAEGNPSQAALVQEFSRLYPALVKAIPAPANEAFHQMLLRQVKQWIHWRRLDQSDTSDPEGLLQRINLDLQKGLNDDALKQIRSLPDTIQAAARPIERLLSQRIEASKAGEHLLKYAIGQLAQSAQNKGGAQ